MTAAADETGIMTKRRLQKISRRAMTALLILDPLALVLAVLPIVALARYLWCDHLLIQTLIIVGVYHLCAVSLMITLALLGLCIRPPAYQANTPLDERGWSRWLLRSCLTSLPRRLPMRNLFSARSPIGTLFLRMMGARIGRNVAFGINTAVADPEYVTIDDEATLGDGAYVVGHSYHSGRLIIAPVRIGRGATIGVNAFLSAGADIGEDAIVAAGAVLAKNTKIGPREIWGGVPARKIGEVPPEQDAGEKPTPPGGVPGTTG